MKLITNCGNSAAVKLLIAAELKDIHLDVQKCNPDSKMVPYMSKVKLPVLELPNGQLLSSSNAACRFIYKEEVPVEVEEWLEWEVAEFQPLLSHVLAQKCSSGKIDTVLLEKLKKLLKTLDTAIQNNPEYLTLGSLSVADIVVWSAVLPLFCADSQLSELCASLSHLTAWYNKLSQLPAFSAGLGKLPGGCTWAQVKPAQPVVTAEEIAGVKEAWAAGCGNFATVERAYPVLPNDGARNIMITSALPYVNNVPHLGNIIGCVLSADVYSRFCRLRNYNSLFVCGTDEYGTATETKALEEGITPKQVCDKYNKLHTQIYEWFNIGFDYFGRTTTKQQTEIAQDIFWKLNKNGYILKDSMDQLQCQKCDRFLADRFVEGTCPLCAYEDARGDQCDKCGKLINAIELHNPRCKVCNSTPIVKTSQHLFMDLPAMEPLLQAHLDTAFEHGLWSANAKLITQAWLRDGLKPRCITRDLKWGTPVPLDGYTDKVFYVWYDAPIGYISITANYTDQWEKWWKNPKQVQMINFMAKDNVPFHSVIFPSSLLGADDNWIVVNHLSATEYLSYEDTKFSKSRGVGVFGSDVMDTGIPADIWRFYLLYIRPESQDSAFCWDDFVLKNNSELLNNLGNFINRALTFLGNFFDGVIPALEPQEEDWELIALINREITDYINNLEKIRLRDGIRSLLCISRLGNQYMQANKPWVLVKGSPQEKARAGTVVGLAANVACLLSTLLQPYMPATTDTIRGQLQAPASSHTLAPHFVCYLRPGHKIGQPKPLFDKIDPSMVAKLKERFAGKQQPTGTQPTPSPAAPTVAGSNHVAQLTEAVAQQGEKVRKLKAEKADKGLVNVEVTKLLALKKQLTTAQTVSPAQPATAAPVMASPEEVARLTEAVAQQGEKVRKLKAEKADKSLVSGEVTKLLALKKQLTTAQTVTPAQPATAVPVKATPEEVARLTDAVTQQGEVVRKLKSEKADKPLITTEVNKLLALKKELGEAQGTPPPAASAGGSKKKKGKK